MTAKTSVASEYKQAMDDLRHGRIDADGFRATVRAMKAQHGESAVMQAKLSAIVSSNR
jgi:hypothetical protein